ncbi:MAG: hypothetical protein NPIRA01_05140 [Nitrospirales bacterium]|nr:MAG: hypothetical protein NPIRA01_05140 [Nitrospirales bacterium]
MTCFVLGPEYLHLQHNECRTILPSEKTSSVLHFSIPLFTTLVLDRKRWALIRFSDSYNGVVLKRREGSRTSPPP